MYQPLVEEAIDLSFHKPERIVIWQREQLRWGIKSRWNVLLRWLQGLDFGGKTTRANKSSWQEFVDSAKARGIKADCVPVKSGDPAHIMHTSGTTGAPKGVRRDAGGHVVGLHLTIN